MEGRFPEIRHEEFWAGQAEVSIWELEEFLVNPLVREVMPHPATGAKRFPAGSFAFHVVRETKTATTFSMPFRSEVAWVERASIASATDLVRMDRVYGPNGSGLVVHFQDEAGIYAILRTLDGSGKIALLLDGEVVFVAGVDNIPESGPLRIEPVEGNVADRILRMWDQRQAHPDAFQGVQ